MKLDRRNIDAFAARLHDEFPKVAKAATATALNRTAHAAELFARRNVKRQFTLRNRWTLGSISSTTTPLGRAIDQQFTMVGSKQSYLAKQEAGGELSRTPEGRRITTSYGSREGPSAQPRKKVATGRFAARNIRLGRSKGRGSSPRQRFLTVITARRKGRKFVFMELADGRTGIFFVMRRSIRMVHRMIDKPATIKSDPWLRPAVDKARKTAPAVFRQELIRRFRP